MLDTKYMKILNKRSKLLAMILVVVVVLALSIMSQQEPKNVSIKTSYEINRLVEVCYISCDRVKEYDYYSVISDIEALQRQVAIVAEEKRVIELTKMQADVEAERLRLAEAERKERARLAKVELDKQREIRREAKRLADIKEKKMQNKIVSRSNEYKGVNQDLGTFNVSWYGNNCTGCHPEALTASGISVKNSIYYQGYGVAASDWTVIPLYSIIEVEGYGKYIILDRGGAIKNRKLDLLTTSEAKSNEYGRQQLKVTVLRWGNISIK